MAKWMQSLYDQFCRAIPLTIKGIFRPFRPNWVSRWLGPLNDSDYIWDLGGVLAGHRLCLNSPEQGQLVFDYEPHVCEAIQHGDILI